MQLQFSFGLLLGSILCALSSVQAAPVTPRTQRVSFPLTPLRRDTSDVPSTILLQQHLNNAHKRHARALGLPEPSPREAAAAMALRIRALPEEHRVQLSRRYNRVGVPSITGGPKSAISLGEIFGGLEAAQRAAAGNETAPPAPGNGTAPPPPPAGNGTAIPPPEKGPAEGPAGKGPLDGPGKKGPAEGPGGRGNETSPGRPGDNKDGKGKAESKGMHHGEKTVTVTVTAGADAKTTSASSTASASEARTTDAKASHTKSSSASAAHHTSSKDSASKTSESNASSTEASSTKSSSHKTSSSESSSTKESSSKTSSAHASSTSSSSKRFSTKTSSAEGSSETSAKSSSAESSSSKASSTVSEKASSSKNSSTASTTATGKSYMESNNSDNNNESKDENKNSNKGDNKDSNKDKNGDKNGDNKSDKSKGNHHGEKTVTVTVTAGADAKTTSASSTARATHARTTTHHSSSSAKASSTEAASSSASASEKSSTREQASSTKAASATSSASQHSSSSSSASSSASATSSSSAQAASSTHMAKRDDTNVNAAGVSAISIEAAKVDGLTNSDDPSGADSLALDIEANDVGYVATVQMGTPPRDFTLIMDSGSADLWVGGEACTTQMQGQNFNCGDHTFLGKESSSSFTDSGKPFDITYGSGSVAGNIVTDNLVVAGLSLKAHTFGVASQESVQFAGDKNIDGLMGLAQSSLSEQKTLTPPEALAKAGLIDSAVVSYRIPRLVDEKKNGEISFGSIDEATIDKSTLVTVDNVSKIGFWEAAATFSVNGKDVGLSGRTAILDTGTTLIIAPPADAAALHKLIPGAKEDTANGFTIPCTTSTSIALTFGNSSFAIDPRDLLFAPLDPTNLTGDCMSGIQAGVVGADTEWLVGDVFLKNVIFAHDVAKNQISLAKPAQ